jgi:hypothetical protein
VGLVGIDAHGAQPLARPARRFAGLGGLSRAKWLVTASRTGCGGMGEPALLKWRTFATPRVSDLSNGTSSVMTASSPARGGHDATRGPG